MATLLDKNGVDREWWDCEFAVYLSFVFEEKHPTRGMTSDRVLSFDMLMKCLCISKPGSVVVPLMEK